LTWQLIHIQIQGVKGVLDQSGVFNLRDGKSIAIFAPNGCGKSGYADAIEYLFSLDGEVQHLGKGGADSELGGKHALCHVLSEEKNITPTISALLRNTSTRDVVKVSREVNTGRNDPLPIELKLIIRTSPAYRILRQHDLRQFVVYRTPREKYSDLSRWLGLERLENILTHLTRTANTLGKTDPDREIRERLQDISNQTSNDITEYNKEAIFQWCSDKARIILKEEGSINSIDDLKSCLKNLTKLRDSQILQSDKVSEINKAKVNLQKNIEEMISDFGCIEKCRGTLKDAIEAKNKTETARRDTKESVFQEVWNEAQGVLTKTITKECPICLTPWDATTVISQQGALNHVSEGLRKLTDLSNAQSEELQAITKFKEAANEFTLKLSYIDGFVNVLSLEIIDKDLKNMVAILNRIVEEDIISSTNKEEYEKQLQKCQQLLKSEAIVDAQKIKTEDMPESAKVTEELIKNITMLTRTVIRLKELHRLRQEFDRVYQSFDGIATVIQEQAGTLINKVVGELQDDMGRIYRKIHKTTAVPNIHIDPDTNSKTLKLRIDFYSADRTVPPAGYLSESQINTLGLALFIASVRLFNRKFPFVVLDDIVSSYDADHRARIVDIIVEELTDFQVFLTTHDKRFYNMLKSRLSGQPWMFEQITSWEIGRGPKKQSDTLSEELIRDLINSGNPQPAGNSLRVYIEEWLDKMCEKYCVHTIHKRGDREYTRTLFDFWEPFINRLKKIRGGFFSTHVETVPCFQRLASHTLLNYYSHSQADPYSWSAMGDVEYVLTEFTNYQKIFNCHSCLKILKYDPADKRVYCTCGNLIFPP